MDPCQNAQTVLPAVDRDPALSIKCFQNTCTRAQTNLINQGLIVTTRFSKLPTYLQQAAERKKNVCTSETMNDSVTLL